MTYVRSECIGTLEWSSKFQALRSVIKRSESNGVTDI